MLYFILSILSDLLAACLLQLLFITIFGWTVSASTKKMAITYSKGIFSVVKVPKKRKKA